MSPDTWTTAEMVRAIQRIEQAQASVLDELRSQRHETVSRDVWEEWKRQVAIDIVNLEAEQARIRKDMRTEIAEMRAAQRWAVGLAVTAALGAVATFINALGLGAS